MSVSRSSSFHDNQWNASFVSLGLAASLLVAGLAVVAVVDGGPPPPSAGPTPQPSGEGLGAAEKAAAKTRFPRPWPASGAFATWSHEQSSSGGGNRDEVTASFTSRFADGRWSASCRGALAWESVDGSRSTRALAGRVEGGGAPLAGPRATHAGASFFLPSWEGRQGCERVAEATWVEASGVERRRFTINGEPRVVAVWKGVVPADADGFPAGEGTAYWDVATGLLVAFDYEGHSGSARERLVRTDAPLAYR